MVRISKIDNKDKKIIEILEENARTPYTEIAKALNITEAAVRKRIKKLEEFGVIKKYTIEVDNRFLGRKIAWIGIDIDPDKYTEVLSDLKRLNARRMYISIGDHDLMLEFVYEREEELENLVKSIKKIQGIIRVCPAILTDIII